MFIDQFEEFDEVQFVDAGLFGCVFDALSQFPMHFCRNRLPRPLCAIPFVRTRDRVNGLPVSFLPARV
jgi:hypothetical protein